MTADFLGSMMNPAAVYLVWVVGRTLKTWIVTLAWKLTEIQLIPALTFFVRMKCC